MPIATNFKWMIFWGKNWDITFSTYRHHSTTLTQNPSCNHSQCHSFHHSCQHSFTNRDTHTNPIELLVFRRLAYHTGETLFWKFNNLIFNEFFWLTSKRFFILSLMSMINGHGSDSEKWFLFRDKKSITLNLLFCEQT